MRTLFKSSLLVVLSPVVACGGGAFSAGPNAGGGGSGGTGPAMAQGGTSPAGGSGAGTNAGGGGIAGSSSSVGGSAGIAGTNQVGTAGQAGSTGEAGSGGAPIGACDASSIPYKCNATLLQKCNVSAGLYQTVKTCAKGMCDAARGQCDACAVGDANPNNVCSSDGQQDVCKTDLTGFGLPRECPAGAPDCVGNKCEGCTAASDCPAPPNACKVPTCDTGTCGFSNAEPGTVADSSNVCATKVCTTDGTISDIPQLADGGTACGDNGVCDGAGHCGGYLSAPVADDGTGPGPATVDKLYCVDGEAPPTGGIFVSAQKGDDTASGTETAPVATLQRALALVSSSAAHVYVDAGTYNEAVVIGDIGADLTIEGGWSFANGTWSRNCAVGGYGSVVIQAVAADASTSAPIASVVVDSGSRSVTLRNLSVLGADYASSAPAAAGASGASSIAIFRRSDSPLTLVAVDASAMAAQAGGAGAEGAAGTFPKQPCDGSASNGATGDDGANGVPSDDNSPYNSQSVYSPLVGANGGDGKPGANGAVAPLTDPVTCVTGVTCSGPVGCHDTSSTHGTIVIPQIPVPYECGASGLGGGKGGGGGGASIALAAHGTTTVVATSSRFRATTGGVGGAGGPGGPAPDPGISVPQQPKTCDSGGCATTGSGLSQQCVPKGTPYFAYEVTTIGRGFGGKGGVGFPGNGGDAIAVVLSSNGTWSSVAPTNLHSAGPAAAPGGAAASPGDVDTLTNEPL